MKTEAQDLKAKFVGGMVGSALGDAIGELAFRYHQKDTLCAKLDSLPELHYTDDTAMAHAVTLDPRKEFPSMVGTGIRWEPWPAPSQVHIWVLCHPGILEG